MNNEHEAKIIMTLTPYLMAFPQSKMNEGSLLVYAKALSSLSIAEIEASMLKLMRTNRFFPSVADIFEQANNIDQFLNKSSQKSSDEAWSEVMKEVHNAFIYRKPKFSSKEVERAALNMGWTSLCNLEVDAMNTARSQFMRIYDSIINRSRNEKTNQDIINALPSKTVNELVAGISNKFMLEKPKEDNKK